MESTNKEKYTYFASNLFKGFIWLVVIVFFFLALKFYFDESYLAIMENFANRPILVFIIFSLSEIFFGIIPPEIFMIWATHQDSYSTYMFYTVFFGLISYAAGIVGYFFGFRFSMTRIYAKVTSKFGSEMEKNIRKYSGFMIFIAAVTPVPFTAVCMLTGASKYKLSLFFVISLSRLLRFGVYGYAIWHVNQV